MKHGTEKNNKKVSREGIHNLYIIWVCAVQRRQLRDYAILLYACVWLFIWIKRRSDDGKMVLAVGGARSLIDGPRKNHRMDIHCQGLLNLYYIEKLSAERLFYFGCSLYSATRRTSAVLRWYIYFWTLVDQRNVSVYLNLYRHICDHGSWIFFYFRWNVT